MPARVGLVVVLDVTTLGELAFVQIRSYAGRLR